MSSDISIVQTRIDSTLPELQNVFTYDLTSPSGLTIKFTNLGLITMAARMPDRNGTPTNVVLGFDTLDEYLLDDSSQGRVVLPYANRISNANIVLPDGRNYPLYANNGPNNLHSGVSKESLATQGSAKIWTPAGMQMEKQYSSLYFKLGFNHLEGGFPGPLDYFAEVCLSIDNIFSIKLTANAYNGPAVSNPTVHTYFNLDGINSGTTVKEHILQTNASQYLVTDDNNIPLLGNDALCDVTGTPFDFRKMRQVYVDTFPALWDTNSGGVGYDHCLVSGLNNHFEATVVSPKTGIGLTVSSNQPSGQIYTAHYLTGKPAAQYGGICVEPGKGINAINRSDLWDVIGSPLINPNGTQRFDMDMKFFIAR